MNKEPISWIWQHPDWPDFEWKKVAKVSKATATRHLANLLAKGCITKLPGGGRNTRYHVNLSSSVS